MKPLVDALTDVIARYDTKDPHCPFCQVRPEEVDHADNCSWATLIAWRDDVNGIVDRIREKAGLATSTKVSDSSIPAEIIEERRR